MIMISSLLVICVLLLTLMHILTMGQWEKNNKKIIMDMWSHMILFSEYMNSIYIPVFHLVSLFFFFFSEAFCVYNICTFNFQ